ncbi:hypothetical protein SDC9_184326 [bioreactor metagenome]|uniref:Uncharacterized protein n=1 Tax=bioreactor metagenome TaxID=1076179 RepID=A0A645HCQ6_9ZZZZ
MVELLLGLGGAYIIDVIGIGAKEYIVVPALENKVLRFKIARFEVINNGLITIKTVGCNGNNVIPGAKVEMLGHFYCAYYICEA